MLRHFASYRETHLIDSCYMLLLSVATCYCYMLLDATAICYYILLLYAAYIVLYMLLLFVAMCYCYTLLYAARLTDSDRRIARYSYAR